MTFYQGLYVFAGADRGHGRRDRKKPWLFIWGFMYSICRCRQAAWTQRPEKTMTFYPGLYVVAGVDRRRGWRDRKKPWLFIQGFLYLQVQTGGVDAETGKSHDFLSGALFIMCRQAAWMQRPVKTLTFYPELYLSGADKRRERRDR